MMFHPFWLVMVVAVLLIIGLPFVFIAVLAALLSSRRAGQPSAYGLRSPDGRWWWDGHQWQPIPPAGSDEG